MIEVTGYKMKSESLEQSARFVWTAKVDPKEIAAFFAMLSLLVFMVAFMTGAPSGL